MLLDFNRLGALRAVLSAIALLVGAFLLLPIVVIVLLSFGSSRYLQFPPPAWTPRWYEDLFDEPDWPAAFATSFKIAIVVATAATLLGLMASFGLARGRFPARKRSGRCSSRRRSCRSWSSPLRSTPSSCACSSTAPSSASSSPTQSSRCPARSSRSATRWKASTRASRTPPCSAAPRRLGPSSGSCCRRSSLGRAGLLTLATPPGQSSRRPWMMIDR